MSRKRQSAEGFVVIDRLGQVRGVGLSSIGAVSDACWDYDKSRTHWKDLEADGWRCIPAQRITTTYEGRLP